MENEKPAISENIGKQVDTLLEQSGLTVTGLAFALKMSVNHLRRIKVGKASISKKTAKKICSFFEIEDETLSSAKLIKLKSLEKNKSVKKFYEENKDNKNFFIDKQREGSIAHFLRTVLIPEKYLENEHDVSDIREYINKTYKTKFKSKEISRQLGRLVEEGLLTKRDRFGNGSTYLYKKNNPQV